MIYVVVSEEVTEPEDFGDGERAQYFFHNCSDAAKLAHELAKNPAKESFVVYKLAVVSYHKGRL